ncbi:MAG: response regulator [Candidatus Abyssobacteria bacterium SURF_17]|jgi:DNA-binding response OmpR family regulator|uniref:Response regulator n=1 Tax=Candidatus Abyssobacteria bacterium SURF_17 TaxID=2093361 RepID=A0A419F0M6_9BACT|nr:MAG: response regulator [Candidatus Abyssubacteria bacterium SURF_17]
MRKKILLVEDNRNIIMTTRMALEAREYELTVAIDGCEAIAKALSCEPDAILLDLVSPNLDGLDVLRELQKQQKMRGIPVIIISAKAAEEDIREARRLGAREYIVKPFGPEELVGAIARVLAS